MKSSEHFSSDFFLLQAIKRSLAEELDVVTAIRKMQSYSATKRMFSSPNIIEGPTAFAQKRKPIWSAPEPLRKFEEAGGGVPRISRL